jgi:hypothetical protein
MEGEYQGACESGEMIVGEGGGIDVVVWRCFAPLRVGRRAHVACAGANWGGLGGADAKSRSGGGGKRMGGSWEVQVGPWGELERAGGAWTWALRLVMFLVKDRIHDQT